MTLFLKSIVVPNYQIMKKNQITSEKIKSRSNQASEVIGFLTSQKSSRMMLNSYQTENVNFSGTYSFLTTIVL